MQSIDCIKTRRSIRKFKDTTVDNSLIRELVDIARYAPSWKNSQTTRYIAIKDSCIKTDIATNAVLGYAGNTTIISGAPVLVVVATKNMRSGYERDGSFSTSKGTHWQSFDAGIATQTLSLVAHEKGLATVIMGVYDEAKVKSILHLNDDLSVSALVALGYADIEPQTPRRKEVDELLTIIE